MLTTHATVDGFEGDRASDSAALETRTGETDCIRCTRSYFVAVVFDIAGVLLATVLL
jgi:hypothetical protein